MPLLIDIRLIKPSEKDAGTVLSEQFMRHFRWYYYGIILLKLFITIEGIFTTLLLTPDGWYGMTAYLVITCHFTADLILLKNIYVIYGELCESYMRCQGQGRGGYNHVFLRGSAAVQNELSSDRREGLQRSLHERRRGRRHHRKHNNIPEAEAEISSAEFYDSSIHSQMECVICLEDYENGDEIRKLDCGHFFHIDCIGTWLETGHPSCPLCRDVV